VDRPVLSVALALACALAVLGGCSDDGGTTATAGGCGPERREALDPASSVHVLSGPEPEYRSDPPTSGPHAPGPVLSGVRDEPLARPAQVGDLESGGVLLQFRPGLDPADEAALEALAGEGVAVAPNPDLPSPVVATAWLTKQECDGVDVDALQAFVDAHVGNGPGSDG